MFSVTPADNVEGDLYVVLRGEECDAAELTGPQPTGLRYCMNSAALRFIPKGDMAAAGYGDYIYMIAPPIS